MADTVLWRKSIVMISSHGVEFNGRFSKIKQSLQRAGANVFVVVLDGAGESKEENCREFSRYYSGRIRVLSSLSYREQKSRVFGHLDQIRADAYHAMDYVSMDVAAAAKVKFGGSLVFDACEIFTDLAGSTSQGQSYVDNVFRSRAELLDAVVTPNSLVRDYYAQRYPNWPLAKNINNSSPCEPVQAYDSRMHFAANLPLETKIAVYHGGFSELRGLQGLVQTADKLPKNYALVLLGWGKLQPRLVKLAQQANDRAGRRVAVILPPVPQSELMDWISGATYGLIPYRDGPLNHSYCTPNKLYEFPAAGVPVLCTSLPQLKNMVDKYGIGHVLQGELSGGAIANHIASQVDLPPKAFKNNCASFLRAEGWSGNEKKLLQLYQSLLDF